MVERNTKWKSLEETKFRALRIKMIISHLCRMKGRVYMVSSALG